MQYLQFMNNTKSVYYSQHGVFRLTKYKFILCSTQRASERIMNVGNVNIFRKDLT
jgi:hypothetical protein